MKEKKTTFSKPGIEVRMVEQKQNKQKKSENWMPLDMGQKKLLSVTDTSVTLIDTSVTVSQEDIYVKINQTVDFKYVHFTMSIIILIKLLMHN